MRTFLSLRRSARRTLPLARAVLFSAGIALHAVVGLHEAVVAMVALLLGATVMLQGWRRSKLVEQCWRLDLEVGCLLMLIAYAIVVHVNRSLLGNCYPLVYLGIAVVSVVMHRSASLAVVALTITYELGLSALAFEGPSLVVVGPHVLFMVGIALINMLSLRTEMVRLRRASKSALQADRERLREEARSYRLLRAPSQVAAPEPRLAAARAHDEERLLRSGVEQIEVTLMFALELLRQSLHAHTAMVLWLDDRGSALLIAELVSNASDEELAEGPFSTRDGILGAVLSQHKPVCISQLKPSYLLPYYRDVCPVQAVCAVPVFEHGGLRGVLVVDRRVDEPFTAGEQQLVEQAARFSARAIENERVFVQLERTKVEQGKLYRASERLGAAIGEQEVVDAGVLAASEIAAVDFAAFAAYDEARDEHQIRGVRVSDKLGADARLVQLEGQCFAANKGLVAMAVRNRHPLPYRGEYDPCHQLLFDRQLPAPDMPSLLVLPLFVHDEPLGALVLASEQERAFHDAARNLLEVLASHLAVSLANARMVRQLEEQATTDGLTGLLNKRALFDVAAEKIAAAKRFGRQLSVLVADIDHFKQVNDNHGHDVGDIVIKELATIHQRNKRSTDAVARFGGEEFVTVCEETDAAGALLLAERIRDELRATVFHAAGQELSCTCSIGIATFPAAGSSWHELFKAADDALYISKRSGRDRATIWRQPGRDSAA